MRSGPRTATLAIVPTAGGHPSRLFDRLPWYPGLRVLDLLMLADASLADDFTFRSVYGAEWGAFIDQVDGLDDGPAQFWMLYIDGQLAERGVSETLVQRAGAVVELRFEAPLVGHPQTEAKLALTKALRSS